MNIAKQGFTLLEVLMAIAIFAVVIALAYSSYNATFHIINGAGVQAELYSKARTALERIQEDLESLYPGEEMLFKGTTESVNGYRADNLHFTSTANVRLHPRQAFAGHAIIRYQVQEDPETGTLQLFRSEQPALAGVSGREENENLGYLLCDNLQEVAFDYRNMDGVDMETWGDEDETMDASSLPELINITLRFADGEDGEEGTLFKTALILPAATR